MITMTARVLTSDGLLSIQTIHAKASTHSTRIRWTARVSHAPPPDRHSPRPHRVPGVGRARRGDCVRRRVTARRRITAPDGSSEGWVPTDDGAFVVGEPQGAPGWFAANDTPTDKATYDVQLTVPDRLTAVGNGALISQRSKNGWTTFHWFERYPMASYLATITFGVFEVKRGRTPGGIPTYVAVDPKQDDAWTVLAKLPEIVDYFSGLYGRYPFETVGAIVDNAPKVGYALETQTKPVFDSAPDEAT